MSKGDRKPLPPIETLGESRAKAAKIAKRYGTKLQHHAEETGVHLEPDGRASVWL